MGLFKIIVYNFISFNYLFSGVFDFLDLDPGPPKVCRLPSLPRFFFRDGSGRNDLKCIIIKIRLLDSTNLKKNHRSISQF